MRDNWHKREASSTPGSPSRSRPPWQLQVLGSVSSNGGKSNIHHAGGTGMGWALGMDGGYFPSALKEAWRAPSTPGTGPFPEGPWCLCPARGHRPREGPLEVGQWASLSPWG